MITLPIRSGWVVPLFTPVKKHKNMNIPTIESPPINRGRGIRLHGSCAAKSPRAKICKSVYTIAPIPPAKDTHAKNGPMDKNTVTAVT